MSAILAFHTASQVALGCLYVVLARPPVRHRCVICRQRCLPLHSPPSSAPPHPTAEDDTCTHDAAPMLVILKHFTVRYISLLWKNSHRSQKDDIKIRSAHLHISPSDYSLGVELKLPIVFPQRVCFRLGFESRWSQFFLSLGRSASVLQGLLFLDAYDIHR